MLSKTSLNLHHKIVRSSFSRFLSQNPKYPKVYSSSLEAVQDVKDGSTIMFGGFGVCGVPENLIRALREKNVKKITAISNDAGVEHYGLGILIDNNQVDHLYASYLGEHKGIASIFNGGELELNLVPQGTLAEKIRCGGAGIPAFYTPTGYGTVVQKGHFPIKFKSDGTVEKFSPPKEVRKFNDVSYVLEEALVSDVSCIKAWKADPLGNVIFRATARNFNCDMAKATTKCIVEVEELVEEGAIPPDEVHLPSVYVDRIVVGEKYIKMIEKVTNSDPNLNRTEQLANYKKSIRDRIAARAAKEFTDGMYANLGIGVPTVASNYIADGIHVVLQSENGLLGTGPYPLPGKEDADLVNAGKETVTYVPESSTFSSSESFAMIRGKHIDLTCLGALEVASNGDLASWIIPGKTVKGMGGAMDLVAACEKVIVTMTHTEKNGKPKILDKCTLPLTGTAVADMIITELAVFLVDRHFKHGGGMVLLEISEDTTLEEVIKKTGAKFKVSENLKTF